MLHHTGLTSDASVAGARKSRQGGRPRHRQPSGACLHRLRRRPDRSFGAADRAAEV